MRRRSWTLDAGDASGRTLLGKIGAATVITLTLTGDVNAAGGGDVATPTVTATLSDNFPHENAPDADSLTITGLVVSATDTDGEVTTGTVNVTVIDDQPDVDVVAAVADGTPTTDSVAEGGTLNGTWTLNDGADDVASITVSVAGQADKFVTLPGGAPVVFNLTAGTLTVNANLTWSFVANNNVDSTPPPVVSFTVTATDGDGDVRLRFAHHHGDGWLGRDVVGDCVADSRRIGPQRHGLDPRRHWRDRQQHRVVLHVGVGRDFAEFCGEPIAGRGRAGQPCDAHLGSRCRRRDRTDAARPDRRRHHDHADADRRRERGRWRRCRDADSDRDAVGQFPA